MKPVAREWQLVLPLALFFAVFVFAPLALLGVVSFYNDPTLTTPGVAQYVKFLTDRFNMAVLGQTLWLGLLATVMALVIGYPLAYIYMVAPVAVQRILMLVIVLPLLTSAVVRTFAWVVILGRQGIVNSVLAAAGLIDAPVRLLYTPAAVVVALAQIQLPLMVLPVITALGNIDPNLRHASHALGAGRWRTFVYAASVSAFVTQTLVGGGQLMLMPQYMYQQAIQANNYPFAAAIAMILLVAVLAIVILVNLVSRRTEAAVHG